MAQYTTPPKPSQLNPSTSLASLAVELDVASLFKSQKHDIEGILAFQRLANYLSAAQIFLQSNSLLQKPLTKDDIKPRLLGHWGTCGGLNLTYTHATALITRHAEAGEDVQMVYITGPGHGAPAILSVLYLEVSYWSTPNSTPQSFNLFLCLRSRGFFRIAPFPF